MTDKKPTNESIDKKSVQRKMSKAREPKDFEKYALVAKKQPTHPDQFVMDGTSHIEISVMANANYSSEIIGKAFKIFDFQKLQKLKEKKDQSYLNEGKRQIIGLWGCVEALTVHTSLFNVSFLIAIGKILNYIEAAFEKKSDYTKWLKTNFGHKHLRYFQHAKQLDRMGDFARVYASLGKNRLLEYVRLKREPLQSYEDILKMYPFEDTAADHDGVLFKEHVDGIISLRRLLDAKIDFIEFDQAALIAAHSGGAITVKKAESISAWLENMDDKNQALDDLILNKLSSPYEDNPFEPRQITLTKHLAELVQYSENADIENDDWIQIQRDQISEDDIVKVHQFIVILAEKLAIELNNNEHRPDESSGERGET